VSLDGLGQLIVVLSMNEESKSEEDEKPLEYELICCGDVVGLEFVLSKSEAELLPKELSIEELVLNELNCERPSETSDNEAALKSDTVAKSIDEE